MVRIYLISIEMNTDLLNNITLVIPIHNRHKYLTRLLDFYSSVEIKIFIADSSQKKYSMCCI